MKDARAELMIEVASDLSAFADGKGTLSTLTVRLERLVQDAEARDEDAATLRRVWGELEIINAIVLADERDPTEDERRDAEQIGRKLLDLFRSRLAAANSAE